jgi:hypothetical protein
MKLHVTATAAQTRHIIFKHQLIITLPTYGYFYLDLKLDNTNCKQNFVQSAILWPHSSLQAVCIPRGAIRYSGCILRAGRPTSFSGLKLGLSHRCSAKRLQAWCSSPQGQSKTWRGTGGSHWRGAAFLTPSQQTKQASHPLWKLGSNDCTHLQNIQ